MKHLLWKTIVVGVWFAAASGPMLRAQQTVPDLIFTITLLVGGKIVYDAAEAR